MEVKCHILAQMFIETGLEATEAREEALEAGNAEAVGSEDETDEAEQEAGETVQAKSLQRSPVVADFYGTGIEIWAEFGLIGSTEKKGLI